MVAGTRPAAAKAAGQKKGKPTPKAPQNVPTPNADLSAEEVEALYVQLEKDDDSPFGPDGEIRPVQIGKRGRKGEEQVHIFTLDDVKFFVPKRPGPAVTMKFQRNLRRMPKQAAVYEALLDMLGQRALDALADSPDTEPEDVADVILIVSRLLFDALKPIEEASDPS